MAELESILLEAAAAAVFISALPLAASLFVGTVVSIFQSVTQLHDQTIAFVPKVAAVSLVLFLFGPWMIEQTEDLFRTSLESAARAAAPASAAPHRTSGAARADVQQRIGPASSR